MADNLDLNAVPNDILDSVLASTKRCRRRLMKGGEAVTNKVVDKSNKSSDPKEKKSGEVEKSSNSSNVVRTSLSLLFAKPVPVPDDCIDPRWKWFKNCLGALDGTYIDVTIPEEDKSRYRTRKGKISTNVLGVCNRDMNFVYVLSGWEGSASNSRVLRDAISRRNNLKIPIGNYYLVDAGYTNCKGFLAPYRQTRYHVQEWAYGRNAPRNFREYFNKKHSSARNIIEHCFGLLKKRWAILRSPCFYQIKTQNKIIIACCLLQNFIRLNMDSDPEEDVSLENEQVLIGEEHGDNQDGDDEMIDSVEDSNEWNVWRDNLAHEMYNEWMYSRIN
ncbi:protein ALP1-like [Arachis ipaensis]|uniref:protein ALP1-like n=1 Tax=Arachis ipaensis TaxID=130454 RepID=UPI0007AF3634|nr:protein ALP1-like [Arachis ipaensis]